MGKAVRPIRRQVVTTFYKILFLSMGATILTWGIIFSIFLFYNNKLQPANYYESQIPSILEYVEQLQEKLLLEDTKQELEERIPLEGMDYQVLDKHGELLYGSSAKAYIHNEKELMESFNRNLYMRNNIIQFYPVFSQDGDFIGAIGFRYKLTLAASNPQLGILIVLVGFVSFICPFVYFSLFSFLIGRKFSKQMERPFQSLMDGVKKVQNHDLDFQLLEFETVQELQQLVAAFEEMRVALKDSLLRQWQIEEERKEMIAAIAHDLRTPLTIIHGHVEGLLNGGVNDKERLERYLQVIFTSTERAVQLMNQLNTVSIIDQPQFSIEFQSVNIEEFIKNKSNEYDILCEDKNISFTTAINIESSHLNVNIDPQRISQVLDNIVINSIRYVPKNGEILWKTTVVEDLIAFEITDNGPGFQNERPERVFTKFYREDPSRTGTHFGLGLYIAFMIVKKHNGSISAQNRPEGGAYIKVIIPNSRLSKDS
ncbi:sensor histidine kinase [Bacillus niameyensis]|uniref:sensor histidine kinase n=1 Tax=Bacillus niameyensis TaxID=1522308 RepID=UPI0007860CC4|nr:HAMP domain-containing sensor histidine kinase [Bacillus niameyensis]